MTMNPQEIADRYQELSFIDEDLKIINNLCERLISGDHELMVGISILKEEKQEDPKTAYVQSSMGMLAIQVNPQAQPDNDSFTWVIDEVCALRILGVIHEYLSLQYQSIKQRL